MKTRFREWEEGNVTAVSKRSLLGERSIGGARRTAHIFSAFCYCLGSLVIYAGVSVANAQTAQPQATPEAPVQLVYLSKSAEQTGPPLTITLADALQRAQKNNAEFLAALSDQQSAREDRLQAREARLPQFSDRTEYLGTQGNGITPNGRYVTNDGVHVYRQWAVFHQELSANTLMGTGYKRAVAAEAIAAAKAEIARRGLTVAVTKSYYGLVVAQRKYAIAQEALEQARRFLELTEETERAGQAAHSDVIKAQIQNQQQDAAYSEANLGMEDARLNLSVLIFPTLDENFTAVDDLDRPQPLPAFAEVQEMAGRMNPDVRVATEALRQADLDVTGAKTAFLPTISLDPVWGTEANCFAVRCKYTAIPEAGNIPNMGYFITATLTFPVWDWGTLRSKLRQAGLKREQAQVALSQTERSVLGQLYAAYNEALVARAAVDKLRQIANLAAESLRLVTLRYQGGSSTSLEVVDAQATLITARNAYDDVQVRYRTALATLQTFTGSF